MEKKHIVITDDDTSIQDASRLILERAGYQITVFSNGGPLRTNAYERPDLFILDMQLQEENGLEICRFLKEQESTKGIPVIMVSASLNVAQQAASAGADGFLEKPFKMAALREIVARHIV